MAADLARVEQIFNEALEKGNDGERSAYLAEACQADGELLQRVEALLAAHIDADNQLPLHNEEPTLSFLPISERPGSTIGRYKLLEKIGEGGFGVVFMADQEQPIRRRVALKIIKAGMDTKQVVARFEAERQALAMMDHPNIAKVLDAGATDAGRPYFVMELVRGVPITEYCNESRLTTEQRLILFQTVCSAVQHAHQKGIIHRDLKPSNVLVTMHDDKAVPKVIDFGVAKATQGRLTERTLFTEFRQLIGTPTYMSPEQAQLSGLDVDTRSDIYSLGVLLYELLTGTTPIDSKRVASATYDDLRRLICEEDPPSPSMRLSSLSNEELTTLAKQRQCEPTHFAISLKNDLDWIVMKCLEKDRARRYETANGLSRDIERYLNNELVEARAPTRLYRLKKFILRNKVGVVSGSAVGFAIILGIALLFMINARIRTESSAKDAALSAARGAINRMLTRTADAGLHDAPATQKLQQQILEDAVQLYEELHTENHVNPALRLEMAELLQMLGEVQRKSGRYKECRDSYARCIELLETLIAEAPSELAYRQRLALVEVSFGRLHQWTPGFTNDEQALAHFERAFALFTELERDWPDRKQPKIVCTRHLPEYVAQRGDVVEAVSMWQEAVDDGESYLAQEPEDGVARYQIGWAYADLGRYQAYSPNANSPEGRLKNALNMIDRGLYHTAILLENNPRNTSAIQLASWLNLKGGQICFLAGHDDNGHDHNADHYFKESIARIQSLCKITPLSSDAWGIAWTSYSALLSNLRAENKTAEVHTVLRGMSSWLQFATMDVPVDSEADRKLLDSETLCLASLQQAGDTRELNDLAHATITRLKRYSGESERSWCRARQGLAHMWLRQWDIAVENFREAERLGAKWDISMLTSLARSFSLKSGITDPIQIESARQSWDYAHQIVQKAVNASELDETSLNSLAWSLVDSPEADQSVADFAVMVAEKAVGLAPNNGNIVNTLGVAQYRASAWQSATDTLRNSIALRDGGDPSDWLFLAMALWRLDRKEEAHKWLQKAAEWMDEKQPNNEELLRFLYEAVKLIEQAESIPRS